MFLIFQTKMLSGQGMVCILTKRYQRILQKKGYKVNPNIANCWLSKIGMENDKMISVLQLTFSTLNWFRIEIIKIL